MASIRALTSKFPLRKYQPIQLSSIRFYSSQPRTNGPRDVKLFGPDDPAIVFEVPRKSYKVDPDVYSSTKIEEGAKVEVEKRKKLPKKRAPSKKPSDEDAGLGVTTTKTIQIPPGGTEQVRSQQREPQEKEPKAQKKKKKKSKASKASGRLDETSFVNQEITESQDPNDPAPISSILDFGLPNPTKKDSIVASADDSILSNSREHNKNIDKTHPKRKAKPETRLGLDDLFRRYESSFEPGQVQVDRAIDFLNNTKQQEKPSTNKEEQLARATKSREERLKKLDQEWERDEDAFVLGDSLIDILARGDKDDKRVELKEDEADAEAEEWANVTAEEAEKLETAAEEAAKETAHADWLERLEIRRVEQKQKAEEARQKAEQDAWSSEGRGLNTSIIFTQSVQDPSEVDMVWYNHDNYTPTGRYARPTSLEPETILGRRIGDPSQLLSALSNGRNEYQYSLENLRLMRQGMEVAGLHERLRRTKLPFQFPAIRYEDVENIFLPRLPTGDTSACEPFPLIVPQESCVEIPVLWGALEGNSKLLAIHGDIKTCQGYHPAPSAFFTSFSHSYYGYLKPTTIITDVNYRQPYPRQQTTFSFMGTPTMVLLTVPSLPHAEPIEPRNLLAQLIAETFSCHYYNREIMQVQAPIIGLLHYQTQLWTVLYDPVADIPYVSSPIEADFDIPRSHDETERLRYICSITTDAFTCAVINGIEAMRHRQRQEGETDTTMDWRNAAEGMWAVLEARRMIHIRSSGKTLSFRTYVKMAKELNQVRRDLEAALQSIPSGLGGQPGILEGVRSDDPMTRWWMTTKRPDLRDQMGSNVKKTRNKQESPSERQANVDEMHMGEYEYLMR